MAFGSGALGPRGPVNPRTLLLVTLALVIVLVAALQYRWINQVSDAQEVRAKARLSEELHLISAAFDTEVTRAILAFTLPPPSAPSIDNKLEQTWSAWNQQAPWPRIISGISLFEANDGGWRKRSWGDPGAFDSRSLPTAGSSSASSAPKFGRGGGVRMEARNSDLLLDGQLYSLWPLPNLLEPPEEPQMNWLVLHYDLAYLTGIVFPQLVAKFSTAEDRSEFEFHIALKGTAPKRADLVAGAWRFRPDCLMPAGGDGMAVSVSAFAGQARGLTFGARSRVSQVSARQPPSLAFLFHASGQCRGLLDSSGPDSSSSGLFQISVWRAQGALGDVFARFRRRNEILSGVVFGALIAAVAAFVISTERIRRLARLETVLAAGLSHELRTPLASLGVAADDLRSGHVEDSEQARRYGEIISTELRRLGHIADQTLALTRLNRSSRPRFRRSVSVSEIVKAAMDAVAPRLNGAEIKVELQIARNVPDILADPDLVLRSLTNLLENAIKYAASGRWIRLSEGPERHSGRLGVEIAVEDRGPGIGADEAAAVFEPFYRGSVARQCRETGSGLGLAIVKSAVLANGGWIKLERAVPQGCKFRLFFMAEHSDSSLAGANGSLVEADGALQEGPEERA